MHNCSTHYLGEEGGVTLLPVVFRDNRMLTRTEKSFLTIIKQFSRGMLRSDAILVSVIYLIQLHPLCYETGSAFRSGIGNFVELLSRQG